MRNVRQLVALITIFGVTCAAYGGGTNNVNASSTAVKPATQLATPAIAAAQPRATTVEPAVNTEELVLPYQAVYRAKYNGMDIEAHHSMSANDDGTFIEQTEARNFLGRIEESAVFSVTDTGTVQPRHYLYKRSIVGVKKTETIDFDWDALQANYANGKKNQTVALTPGVLDNVTVKLQIRLDLKQGRDQFDYNIAKRGSVKENDYRLLGREILNTDLGQLKTLKLERVHDSDKRRTIIWLAEEWDNLLVQLEHEENDETYTLYVSSASVNNNPVTGLSPEA